jgi:hypothetical protein
VNKINPLQNANNNQIKIIVMVGIVLHNWLIMHFHVIVPNYYGLREWIGILSSVVGLMTIELDSKNEKIKIREIVNTNDGKISVKKSDFYLQIIWIIYS